MSDKMNLRESYNFEDQSGIWIRKDAPPFQYSDGDKVETGVGESLKTVRDRSVMSDELKSRLADWPTVYYFSPSRSSLLRPLAEKLLKGARVLELGAGMGAVTRYLGETAAEVVAVEGSPRRGSVAASRCEGLKNVSVLIDEIKGLPESLGKFDVVTLIGVLEYARRYGGPGAEMEMLRKAKSFLKPDGVLILAIENKLGLKYLGGVPEDHLQRPWLGPTNGYAENGVRTWSRKELIKMLGKAGFKRVEQFVPLPDYKLPTAIVTPEGLESAELNMSAILNNTRRLFEPRPLFNIAEAWESVVDAGIFPDLADSLCFVASPDEKRESPFQDGELLNHYGDLGSLPQKYSKEVKIKKKGGEIVVERRKLAPDARSDDGEIFQIIEDEPYHKGELLISKIRKVAMRPDWTPAELFRAFEPWAKVLRENADEDLKCDGSLLDFAPFNLVVEGDKVVAFDQEWRSREKLPLAWLLYRGFFNTILRILPIRKSRVCDFQFMSDMFREFIKTQGLPSEIAASYDYLWWQEVKFLKCIKNNPRYRPPKDFNILYMP